MTPTFFLEEYAFGDDDRRSDSSLSILTPLWNAPKTPVTARTAGRSDRTGRRACRLFFILLHVVTSSISLVSSPKGRKLSYFAAPPFPTEPAWPRPPSLGLRQFTLSLGFGGNPDFVLRQLSDTGPNPPKQLWPVSVPAASGKAAHSGSCGETRPCFRSFSATL